MNITEEEIIEIIDEHIHLINDAYDNFLFHEQNQSGDDEIYWWDRWIEAKQNCAKSIIDKIKENEKPCTLPDAADEYDKLVEPPSGTTTANDKYKVYFK